MNKRLRFNLLYLVFAVIAASFPQSWMSLRKAA
jgi:hypothetical protein